MGPGIQIALVLAVFFCQSATASFFCRRQVVAHAAHEETTSTEAGLKFLLLPFFSDAPQSFLLEGSQNPFAHSFLASVPQSASEFEAGGPQVLVVNDSAVDPVLHEFLRSCSGEKGVNALEKKLSRYRRGRLAQRLYPQQFARYQKLMARKVVRLGDLLETGFFTPESHLAFAVLSFLAFSHAGVDSSVRLGTLTEHGADGGIPTLGAWFHHYAWMETQNHVSSLSAGVREIEYLGTEGAREVAVGSLFSGLYRSSRGMLSRYIPLPAPTSPITHHSYLPWSISAPEHTVGTLRVQSLQADRLNLYFEAFGK